MPYFIDEKNCVRKGTKAEPGEVVKCHDEHNEAVAHMRALYANVEDAGKGAAGIVHADRSYLSGALRGEPAEKIVVRPVEMVLPSDMDAQQAQSVAFAVLSHLATTDKGGRGSGWHRPPEGTHTAENAPNFRGGPGADRTYGTESDEPPEGSKLCKCTKCKSQFTLPKGKQCEDVKCPGCGGGATQTSPRRDKPAEGEGGRTGAGGKKAVDAPGPQVHGEGGSLGGAGVSLGEDETGCACPHCGEGLSCSAKSCPNCKEKIDRVERGEGEKREMKSEGDGKHPASHYLVVEDPEKSSTWHLRVRNVQGELDHTLMGAAWAALHRGYRGNKYQGPNKEMALAKLRRFYKQEGMDTPSEKSFTIYKSADGHWRWMTLSSWAVVDKEREVVSEQAYRDAIAYAEKNDAWGEMDLVHVDGTDVGDCDMLFILKREGEPAKLGAGGTWHDTAKATRARKVIQAEPGDWGVSLKFRFNPDRLVRGVYTGDIQILKHSILPQKMAASYGTAIAVQQGGNMSKQLDEQAAEALRQLEYTEDEIAELAEKQKALPQEENVVEKEEATQEQPARLGEKLWRSLGQSLGYALEVAPDASPPDEARKAEEVAEPAQETEPVEATAKQATGDEPEADPDNTGEIVKALSEAIVPVFGAMVQEQLDVRDKRIAELQAQVAELGTDIETKVEQRLADMPPVTKVAASSVAAPPEKPTLGVGPMSNQAWKSAMMESINQAVEDTLSGQRYQS